MAFFSVIIPLYNKEDFITRAIQSVLNQYFQDFEIIVVDDGSTDDGLNIVKKHTDSRIKIIGITNKGVAAARNIGIDKSNGKWVAFLDADDYWYKDHLNELNDLIVRFPGVCLVGTGYVRSNDVILQEDLPNNKIIHRKIDYFLEAAENIGIIWTSAVAIKKCTLQKSGGFGCYKVGEDLELWARVALMGQVAISSKITATYLQVAGGIMHTLQFNKCMQNDKPFTSIETISPSVSMLYKYLTQSKNGDKCIYNSIRIYINARILSAMQHNFIYGKLIQLNSLGKLLLYPLSFKGYFWRYFSLLPKPILIFLINFRNLTKKCYYLVKR